MLERNIKTKSNRSVSGPISQIAVRETACFSQNRHVSTDNRWCMTDCCIIIDCSGSRLDFLLDVQIYNAVIRDLGSSRAEKQWLLDHGKLRYICANYSLSLSFFLLPHKVSRNPPAHKIIDGFFSQWHRHNYSVNLLNLWRFWRREVLR